MIAVGRSLASPERGQEKGLVQSVTERVRGLGEHRRGTRQKSGNQLGHRDEQVGRTREQYRPAGLTLGAQRAILTDQPSRAGSGLRASAAFQGLDDGRADVDLVEPFDALHPPGFSALISTTLSPTTSMPTKNIPSATSFCPSLR